MLERGATFNAIGTALGRAPVVILTGPGHSGKTTLARQLVAPDSINHFDLESPPSLARLEEPVTALAPLHGVVAIDDVQRKPDLFPILRVLVDRTVASARFLSLGSATGNLLRQTSERLAGRTERVLLGGFSLRETTSSISAAESTLWRRGGLPRSFLAATEEDSLTWRQEYIQTLLEGAVHSGACACQRPPSDASGPYSRNTMGKCGTLRNRPALGVSARVSCAATSTPFPTP